MSLPNLEQTLELFRPDKKDQPEIDPAERPGTREYYCRQQERLRQLRDSTIALFTEADQSRHK